MKHRHAHNGCRYEATSYDEKEITSRTMTAQEFHENVHPEQHDLYLCDAFGDMAFRSSTGEWIVYPDGRWPGMGPVTLSILQALLLNPGVYLTPRDLGELTGHDSAYVSAALAARVYAIRTTLHDRNESFILTRKTRGAYAVAWNRHKTWLWVERIPGALEDR